MRQRPRTNLHETIAEYFATSKLDIESEIREYIKRKVSRSDYKRFDYDPLSFRDRARG